MQEYEKIIIMKYLRNNLSNQIETVLNEDYIDFKDGSSFGIEDIDPLYNNYTKMQTEIDNYIDVNELDDVIDNIQIQDYFEEYAEYLELNQGCLIDFKDYIIKIIEKI